MRALIERLQREERGITLAELIVAMAITSLLLTLVGSFFVSMTRAQQTVTSVSDSTRQGTTSMNQVGRYLREANRLQVNKTTTSPAFISATSTSVQFYSAVDLTTARAGLSKVTISIDAAGRLQLQRQQGTCPTDGYCTFTGATSSTILATAVRSQTAGTDPQPLFSYLGDGGVPVTNPRTAAAYDSIRSVVVNLEVGSTSGDSANDTTFQATVNLRNLDYGN